MGLGCWLLWSLQLGYEISILFLKIEIISKDNFVIKNLWVGIIFSISFGNVNFLVILDYGNVR